MLVKRFVNTVFNSNTYLLYKLEERKAWVIDPGSNPNELIAWLCANEKQLGGILLTHTHFDHIYGLNDMQEKFPEAKIYASIFAINGMISSKVNGSLYMEIPFTIEQRDYITVSENDKIELWENVFMIVIETPGHDLDCISFHVCNNLFTGDALIPGIKVFTKFKTSEKRQAEISIQKIKDNFPSDCIVWPGHEQSCKLESI